MDASGKEVVASGKEVDASGKEVDVSGREVDASGRGINVSGSDVKTGKTWKTELKCTILLTGSPFECISHLAGRR